MLIAPVVIVVVIVAKLTARGRVHERIIEEFIFFLFLFFAIIVLATLAFGLVLLDFLRLLHVNGQLIDVPRLLYAPVLLQGDLFGVVVDLLRLDRVEKSVGIYTVRVGVDEESGVVGAGSQIFDAAEGAFDRGCQVNSPGCRHDLVRGIEHLDHCGSSFKPFDVEIERGIFLKFLGIEFMDQRRIRQAVDVIDRRRVDG